MTAIESSDDVVLLLEDGPAPPRSNGELVFAEPWQGRAFALAVALHERGAFEWSAFQTELTSRIATWEDDNEVRDLAGNDFPYYELWLAALEAVLANHDLVDGTTLDETTEGLEAADRSHAAAHAAGEAHLHHDEDPDHHHSDDHRHEHAGG